VGERRRPRNQREKEICQGGGALMMRLPAFRYRARAQSRTPRPGSPKTPLRPC
jgi:hypothetical protein